MEKPSGLTEGRAKELLGKFGKNEIVRTKKNPAWKIFLSQFVSPLILLLIGAAFISFYLGVSSGDSSHIDTILILLIVLASGIAGFYQEYKADRAVEALRSMAKPRAIVIRSGVQKEIPASEIVPGDIIFLESGDVIPADAKIQEGRLELDESILTGESHSVKKKEGGLIYSGTSIYSGRALALVEKTGMNTEVGKLAEKMQEIKEDKTPFQLQMQSLGKRIFLFVSVLVLLIVIVRFLRFGSADFSLTLLIAVSLAVAAIPEGLPAVITISLSRAAKTMADKNALVRKLGVVESIGTVDTICTDKTGTLTEGKLKVREFYENGKIVSMPSSDLAAKCCILCNDSKKILKEGKEVFVGDENDIALSEFFQGTDFSGYTRIDEIPFSSERRMHTVVCRAGEGEFVFSKGAPELILSKCSKILKGGKEVKITEGERKKILEENDKLADQARRTLGLAYKPKEKPYESDLIWLGVVSFSDPPRPEVREALVDCRDAGIRTIMITGDNPKTAFAVAKEIGLETSGVVTGDELDKMSDKKLEEALESVNIFARTTPLHKLRILEILQKQGHVVAMTGDGVNDSLAIKKADVGIAMGRRGAEVTREVSDMILLDDNFATIRTAIKEGRRIFDNMQKFVSYMFICNLAEVFVVTTGTILFEAAILYPVQILWINLVTDGLPSIALSADPARSDVMKRKPHKKSEGVIDRKTGEAIIGMGLMMSATLLALFLLVKDYGGFGSARTALFTAFVFYEFVILMLIKKRDNPQSLKDWFSNKFLMISIAVSIVLQLALIQIPLTRAYFDLVSLGLPEFIPIITGMIILLLSCAVVSRVINTITK